MPRPSRSTYFNGTKWRCSLTGIIFLLGIPLAAAPAANPPPETIDPLEVRRSRAARINDRGQVVGEMFMSKGRGYRAFLWTKETGLQNLGTLGGKYSFATDINEQGQIVGHSQLLERGHSQAFLWTKEHGMQGLGTLGGRTSSATGINNLGQVVGSSETKDNERHAFLWTKEHGMQDLGALGGEESFAKAINENGQIIGTFLRKNEEKSTAVMPEEERAFFWTKENGMQDIGTLGGKEAHTIGGFDEILVGTRAFSLNNKGQVAGSSPVRNPKYRGSILHGFLWTGKSGMQDLGTLGGEEETFENRGNRSFSEEEETQVYAINNKGQIVGHSFTREGRTHAFLWSKEQGMRSLGTLGGRYSRALAINEKSQIIGYSDTDTSTHAFIWTKEHGMQDIRTLGGESSEATDINNLGQVVGVSNTKDNQRHAFIWTKEHGMQDIRFFGGKKKTVETAPISGDK